MRVVWSVADAFHALLVLLLLPLRWTKWGGARIAFERKGDGTYFRADWSFEISSEGEYEQVRPWVNELLRQGRQLELVFASESVERAMMALQSAHPNQVRLIRLPLLSNSFGVLERTLTAPHFVMCRYDFFPMLMKHAGRADLKSGLVWASFKGRRHRLNSVLWRWWYRQFFSVFDWIIPATGDDEALFKLIHHNVMNTVDFRVGQIQRRLEDRAETFRMKFTHWDQFQKVLAYYPPARRLVLGSVWESDLGILNNTKLRQQILSGEVLLMVVPHKLSDDWVTKLENLHYQVHHLKDGLPFPQSQTPGLWLINLKGILCELYAETTKVYVGGGFERSIHSVLEPFVAGADVWCGPKVHRSTEAELIQSVAPTAFHSYGNHEMLGESLATSQVNAQGPDHRVHWKDNQAQRARQYIQELKD